MPVDLFPLPKARNALVGMPSIPPAPAFEERWAAWLARGHSHDITVGALGLRLFGGSL